MAGTKKSILISEHRGPTRIGPGEKTQASKPRQFMREHFLFGLVLWELTAALSLDSSMTARGENPAKGEFFPSAKIFPQRKREKKGMATSKLSLPTNHENNGHMRAQAEAPYGIKIFRGQCGLWVTLMTEFSVQNRA